MQVRMLTHITGTRDGVEWPLAGGIVDVTEHEAGDLIRAGLAKEVADATEPTEDSDAGAAPEDGDAPPTEDSDAGAAPEDGDGTAAVKPTGRRRSAAKKA